MEDVSGTRSYRSSERKIKKARGRESGEKFGKRRGTLARIIFHGEAVEWKRDSIIFWAWKAFRDRFKISYSTGFTYGTRLLSCSPDASCSPPPPPPPPSSSPLFHGWARFDSASTGVSARVSSVVKHAQVRGWCVGCYIHVARFAHT